MHPKPDAAVPSERNVRAPVPISLHRVLHREISHQNPRETEGVGQTLMVCLIPSVESKKKCQCWQKQGGRATSHNMHREIRINK